VSADVLDEVSIVEVLREHRPTRSTTCCSVVRSDFLGQPVLTGEVTALGVTRVLDAIRLTNPEIRFYQRARRRCSARSGKFPDRATPFTPQSYGVAKVYGTGSP